MTDTIYLVTTNSKKVEDYNRRLNSDTFEIEHLYLDMNEGRSLSITEIVEEKLKQAKAQHPGKKLLVEDRGFLITALKDFPGPFVKMCLSSIGIEGVIKLMEGVENREAKFVTVLGYYDGQRDHLFVDTEVGFITNSIRKGNIRGWTDLLKIYGYSKYPKKALSELSDEEWASYLEEIEQNDFIDKFVKHIKQG